MSWEKVEGVLPHAKAIVFDGCHKIYLAMDDGQVDEFREYGYGDTAPMYLLSNRSVDHLSILRDWFEGSCGLRFIDSVRTVEGDPNEGFQGLIAQGEIDFEGVEV